jgi:hypothetical protein
MKKLLIILSILASSVASAKGPDMTSTTLKAIKAEYDQEIRQITKKLEKKGKRYLEEVGINKDYAASTAVILKIMIERDAKYETNISEDFILSTETQGNFTGVMFFIKTEF